MAQRTWQGAPEALTNDLLFTSSILDHIETHYRIDTTRSFATGKSQGGGFVGLLACDLTLSSRIAAFAPVAAAFYQPVQGTQASKSTSQLLGSNIKLERKICDPDTVAIECSPSPGRKVRLLEIHGGADTTIKYGGGLSSTKKRCLPSIPHYLNSWAGRNNLWGTASSEPFTEEAVVYRFGEGEKSGLVMHVYEEKVGHSWPATVENDDNKNNGDGPASFNATSVILSFFGKWH